MMGRIIQRTRANGKGNNYDIEELARGYKFARYLVSGIVRNAPRNNIDRIVLGDLICRLGLKKCFRITAAI